MGFAHKAEQLLELPVGALSGEAHIEILGKERVIVSGHCDIREYDDGFVRLCARSGTVCIRGSRLTLDNLHSGGISVGGRILSVELE